MSVGFYGKLSQYPDFVRSDEFSESMEAYTAWFNASFDQLTQQLKESFGDVYPGLPRLKALVRPAAAACGIASLWVPSRDASGRVAPFGILAEIPAAQFEDHFTLLPQAFETFFRTACRELGQSELSFAFHCRRDTIWRLEAALPPETIAVSDGFSAWAGRTILERLLSLLGAIEAGDGGLTLLETVFVALAPMRGKYSNRFQATFRFPLSGNPEEHSLEMAFWMKLTETILHIRLVNHALFWTEKYFDLTFNNLSERLLSLVWIPERQDESLWEFAAMKLSGSMVDPELLGLFRSVAANKGLSLADFITRVERICLNE